MPYFVVFAGTLNSQIVQHHFVVSIGTVLNSGAQEFLVLVRKHVHVHLAVQSCKFVVDVAYKGVQTRVSNRRL